MAVLICFLLNIQPACSLFRELFQLPVALKLFQLKDDSLSTLNKLNFSNVSEPKGH